MDAAGKPTRYIEDVTFTLTTFEPELTIVKPITNKELEMESGASLIVAVNIGNWPITENGRYFHWSLMESGQQGERFDLNSFSIPAEQLVDGTNTLLVTLLNTDDTDTDHQQSVSFAVDKRWPEVEITFPADGYTFQPGEDYKINIKTINDDYKRANTQYYWYVNDHRQGVISNEAKINPDLLISDGNTLVVKLIDLENDQIVDAQSQTITFYAKPGEPVKPEPDPPSDDSGGGSLGAMFLLMVLLLRIGWAARYSKSKYLFN